MIELSFFFLAALLGVYPQSRYTFPEGNSGSTNRNVCIQLLDVKLGLERDVQIRVTYENLLANSKSSFSFHILY